MNVRSTVVVAPNEDALVNAGAVADATATVTVWCATPEPLLAENVNVRVPASACGGP